MGGAVTGRCNDPPHRNIAIVAKIICHCGSTILAELLVYRFRSGLGGIVRDFDQVTIGRRGKGSKLVKIRLSGVIQSVLANRIVDDSFGNRRVAILEENRLPTVAACGQEVSCVCDIHAPH